MFIFDAHNDTLLKVANSGGCHDLQTLPDTHVNLEKLRLSGLTAQIFAVFVPPHFRNGLALNKAAEMIDIFWGNVIKFSDYLTAVKSKDDLENLIDENYLGCILSLEGGEALEGKLYNLRNFFRLGVRGLTLTWNNRNELADGVGEGKYATGLSEFGHAVVLEMNRLGMLVDVSHLAEPGFWQVLTTSSAPVIASHSNAFSLCKHRRNLTDDQIKALADQGGVIGINFCPNFLTEDSKTASIDNVIEHIDYMINKGGYDCVGLGSDFDGIRQVPKGLHDVSTLTKISDKLLECGYHESNIEKIMGKNFLRVTKEVLPEKSS